MSNNLSKKHQAELIKVVELAQKISHVHNKMGMYYQAKKPPTAKLLEELSSLSKALDTQMQLQIEKGIDLREQISQMEQFSSLEDNVLQELDRSYCQSLSSGTIGNEHYRLFYLPFMYKKDVPLQEFEISLKPHQKEALEEFIIGHLESTNQTSKEMSIRCKMYPHAVLDWLVTEKEERFIPQISKSIYNDTPIEFTKYFKIRENLKNSMSASGSEYSMGAIPFLLIGDNGNALDEITFDEQELFEEHIEDIFPLRNFQDATSLSPVNPESMFEESMIRLWQNQLDIFLMEMLNTKKPQDTIVIKSTYIWNAGELIQILMDFQIYAGEDSSNLPTWQDENEEDESSLSLTYHKQMSRESLIDEEPGDLSAFLLNHELLMRTDCRLIFAHEMQEHVGTADEYDEDMDDDVQ